MPYNPLTPQEEDVIVEKGTESPFTGEYDDFFEDGVFICRRCNAPLFGAEAKFDAGCGWPSFDENYPDNINRIPDADGERVEIQCANCKAHLGHVFEEEKLTEKDTRHCVNSLSIRFIPRGKQLPAVLSDHH